MTDRENTNFHQIMSEFYRDRKNKAEAENAKLWDIIVELVRTCYQVQGDEGLRKIVDMRVEELKALLHG